MNRIRLLPEQVANQIAAGEVVERPASVVKELVENALDARARRITVETLAGGRSMIRVQDDGIGMNRDDALLCLERHATSKIQKAEDLASIATMGFRGEALPSIASVSRMTLTTREQDGPEEGSQIIIHGGKIIEVKAAGCAPGTSIEVRQIFFNLPARRKFLRSEETERAHIQHYLTLAAVAHPEVAFTFVQDNRIVWQLPALDCGNDSQARLAALRERMRAVQHVDAALVPVEATATLSGSYESDETQSHNSIRIWGLIGGPGVSRSTREDQLIFVNRRPVENRGLNFALLEGYHTALMKGRYPVCCLFLEIDPAAVDVNIHPSKREVKFHQEFAVRRFVSDAVRNALLGYHQPTAALSGTAVGCQPLSRPEITPQARVPAAPSGRSETPGEEMLAHLSQSMAAPPLARRESPPTSAQAPQDRKTDEPKEPNRFQLPDEASPTREREFAAFQGSAPDPITPDGPVAGPVPTLQVPLRILGVVGQLYVVLESDRGLVLLDQHAAHERILFEQMLGRLEQGQAPSQRLLLPETIELSAKDAQFLREQLANLTRLGVGLSEFGERTFLLDALPPFVKVRDARRFVLELIDELKASGDSVNSWRLGEHTVAKTVCRHAVKANDPLAGPELENLVRDLRHCAMPYTCPHGRPTLIEMNFRELEKKFGRIQ